MKESFGDLDKNRQNSYEAPLPRVVGDAPEGLKQKTKEHFHDLLYEMMSAERNSAVQTLEFLEKKIWRRE